MKIKNNKRGITLIALIITIIILLILAGITVTMLTGENGIINRATEAREETRSAAVQEQVALWNASKKIDEATGGKTAQSRDELLADLEKQGLLTEEEVAIINETGQVEIVEGKPIVFGKAALTLVEMFENGETCEKNDGTCTDETHLHIGDYVNYEEPTTGEPCIIEPSQTGVEYYQVYSLENNDLNWRVLGIEEDEETQEKRLKLIADSPVRKTGNRTTEDGETITENVSPYFDIYGAEAYVYAPDAMDEIGAMFKNGYAYEARSINIEDINQAVGITTDEQIKAKNYFANFAGLPQYGEPYGPFENQWTPEDWLKTDKPTSTVSGTVNGYAYIIGDESVPSEMSEMVVMVENTRLKNMLFENVEAETGKAYWLASRGVYAYPDDDYAAFGLGIVYDGGGMTIAGIGIYTFSSDGHEIDYSDAASVRPVVLLESDITVEEIQKIADQPDSWQNQ